MDTFNSVSSWEVSPTRWGGSGKNARSPASPLYLRCVTYDMVTVSATRDTKE